VVAIARVCAILLQSIKIMQLTLALQRLRSNCVPIDAHPAGTGPRGRSVAV
jgi:hypothetical protein